MTNARPLMIQGTTSSAGKSLVTAGLCRIFHQDGHAVAPFKSQNMALNSYITLDGLEMGRAQVLQAQACGLEPQVDMNPILLKPTGEMGSQLIVNGEVRGQFGAIEYFRMKKDLIPDILAAYGRLSAGREIIVLEGAGSPAEINLKQDDIVNMGMARMVDAPVLLVGDIDRGGVFASLYGTLSLLEPEERQRVKGLIINKFRGDVRILQPGLRMLEDLTGVPVLGVIPMLPLQLDDEDGEADRLRRNPIARPDQLDIAVIRLPRLSNFTDFNVLDLVPDVRLRYVQRVSELGQPDLIILPGSKNTLADLDWLRESGLAAAISERSSAGTPVAGICGGYQMLGEELLDPFGVEQGGRCSGLGLLPGRTTFSQAKTRTRIQGQLLDGAGHDWAGLGAAAGLAVTGYEIHMGQTEISDRHAAAPLLRLADGREDGMVRSDGLVWGSYLHGFFDNTELLGQLLRRLWQRKDPAHGFDSAAIAAIDVAARREQDLDRLADALRSALDLPAIYRLLGPM